MDHRRPVPVLHPTPVGGALQEAALIHAPSRRQRVYERHYHHLLCARKRVESQEPCHDSKAAAPECRMPNQQKSWASSLLLFIHTRTLRRIRCDDVVDRGMTPSTRIGHAFFPGPIRGHFCHIRDHPSSVKDRPSIFPPYPKGSDRGESYSATTTRGYHTSCILASSIDRSIQSRGHGHSNLSTIDRLRLHHGLRSMDRSIDRIKSPRP